MKSKSRKNFLAALALVSLLLFLPFWNEPEGVPLSQLEYGSATLQPYPLLSLVPDVNAAPSCGPECQIDVCLKWVPGPSPQCPVPGPGGGCCKQQVVECDPNCESNPPGYLPPSVSATVDCTPGGNGWCVNAASLNITASDPQGFAVTVSGLDPDFSCAGSCVIALPAGTGTASFTAQSASSGLTATGSAVWKFDPGPPSISHSAAGGGWTRTGMTFTASASDAVSGLASFVIKDNGTTISSPSVLGEGAHIITMTAADNAGNTASVSVTVRVDLTAPSISRSLSTLPSAGGWHTSAPILSVSASDALSGVASLSIKDNGTSISNGAALADGIHSIVITALDVAGNSSTSTFSVKVDTAPPLISPSFTGAPSGGWYREFVNLTVSASDAVSGLSSLVVRDNGLIISAPVSLADGIHSLTFTATDNAGNVSASSDTIQVDSMPPVISKSLSTSPSPSGWHTETPVLSVSVSDTRSGVASTIVRDNGLLITNPATLSDGIHAIVVSAMDAAGNVSTSSIEVKVDSLQPDITPVFTGSLGDHGWYVSAVQVGALHTDDTSGIASTSTLLNGSGITLPVSLTEDGQYVFIFNATDTAGNALSQYSIVKIDRTPPVVDVERKGEVGENGWYRSSVDFQLRASDSSSGPQVGEYRVDGGAWRTGMFFTVSGDGSHSVEYRVFDQAGNVTAIRESVKIDSLAPSVSFLSPSENTPVDKVVSLRGTASDAGDSGLAVVELSVDGGVSWRALSNGDWTFDWKVNGLSNGARLVLLRGRDAAGNVSAISKLTLLVDTGGPIISLADPWTFDRAGEVLVVSNGYDVRDVSVSITNADGALMTSSEYGGDPPRFIWWDGHLDGGLQPAGEYTVLVRACDAHGVCSQESSRIIIPAFEYLTAEEVPPSIPFEVVPAPPISTPSPVLVVEPAQVFEVRESVSSARGVGFLLPLAVSALGLLFALTSLFDPRPQANYALAGAIRKFIS